MNQTATIARNGHGLKKDYAMPFDTPRKELEHLRRREVVLSEQVDALSRIQSDDIAGVVPMLDTANARLSECRDTIRRFKEINLIKTD